MSGHFALSDGRTVALRDGLVIGRGKNCDIVLDDAKASRRHAKVIVESGVVEIEDLGSSNGTSLNGVQVDRRMLRDGDQVQIGKTTLTMRDAPAPAAGGGDDGDELFGDAPAAAGSPGSGAAGGTAAVDDADELFGDAPAATPQPESQPKPQPKSQPKPQSKPQSTPSPTPAAPAAGFEDEDELFGGGTDVVSKESAPTPAAPKPAAPKKNVVEFADEVVEVKQTAKPRSESVASRPLTGGSGEPVVESKNRVLQYSKQAGSRSMLGDDVGQMSGGMRALVFVLVIGGMGALAWLVMNAVR